MNKRIGIVGYKSSDGGSFGAGISFLDYISKFGEPYIIMPHEDIADVDCVLLPGGLDLAPSNYGAYPSFRTTNTDVFKEHFYRNSLPKYVAEGIPMFGICLGFQQLAAFFGCKLVQHFKWHPQSAARDSVAHKLWVDHTVTPFFNDGKKLPKPLEVNSFHHQGVTKSGFNYDELIPMAYAVNEDNGRDDIIEAFMHKTLKIGAVQAHPEDLTNDFFDDFFRYILR
jgi:putative glutamine amidotransferase